MNVEKMLISCFLCLSILAAPDLGRAEDFIITVPVRLYKMVQGVGKAKVTCEVIDGQGQRIGIASKWSTHGVNQYPAGLEEDIVLKFNAHPGKDPRKATDYKCDLKVQLAWVTGEPWQTPSQSSNSMYLKPKPGSEFRVNDTGPLYKTQKFKKPKLVPKSRFIR